MGSSLELIGSANVRVGINYGYKVDGSFLEILVYAAVPEKDMLQAFAMDTLDIFRSATQPTFPGSVCTNDTVIEVAKVLIAM
jgi:hypothetical protein